MPILDPSLQCSLLTNYAKNANETKNGIRFFIKYLLDASRCSNQNESNIETSILFKKDLKKSISFINEEFGSNFTLEKDFNNQNIINCYQYLYDNSLLYLRNKKNLNLKGNYQIYNDKFRTKFFQPEVFYPKLHAWFFSDTPIAVLCINSDEFEKDMNLIKIFNIIKLEVDLMAAAGLTLVFCANISTDTIPFIFEMIYDNQFSEIHFNFFNKDDSSCANNDELISEIYSRLMKLSSYVYIYSQFVFLKNIDDFPRVNAFILVKPPQESFSEISISQSQPFDYFRSGFRLRILRIRVANIPIYNTNNCYTSLAPYEIADFNIVYIRVSDFLHWKRDRIKILYVKENEKYQHIEKYVDFNDVHNINPSLFVKDTFLLADVKEKEYKKIERIQKHINKKVKKKESSNFKKQLNLAFNDKAKITKNIEYVGYAYSYFIKNKVDDFAIHKSQIYSAYQACKSFISKQKMMIKNIELEKKQEKKEIEELNMEEEKEKEGEKDQDELVKLRKNIEKKVSDELMKKQGKLKNEDEIEKEKEKPEDTEKSDDDDNPNEDATTDDQNKQEETIRIKRKGVVYQIETGEGKSCIICLIAAVLALMKKTVHIASSNIKLANRDYMNSFEFFKQLGLKSAVLLHQNELPYNSELLSQNKKTNSNPDQDDDEDDEQYIKFQNSIKNFDFTKFDIKNVFKGNMDEYIEANTQDNNSAIKNLYTEEFYKDELFKNSSKMNFSVCGVSDDNKITKGKANVIFSTFVNFECFYLKMMEMCPGYVKEYFANCCLLIDEADSILIDEITNGTIISRDVKSNINEILKFVYEQERNNKDVHATYQKIKELWPKCCDITENHVKRMYDDIKLVHTDEFSDGKKYSIEPISTKKRSLI